MFRYQLRNILLTPITGAAILAEYLFMFLSARQFLGGDLSYNLDIAIHAGGLGMYFLPVVTSLPLGFFLRYAGSEKRRQFVLVRGKLSSYCGAGVLGALFSGIFVMICAFGLFFLTCLLYHPQGTPYIGMGSCPQADFSPFYGSFFNRPPICYFLLLCAIYILNGALWPMVTLFFSCFTENLFSLVALPLLTYIMLSYTAQAFGNLMLTPDSLQLSTDVMYLMPDGGIGYLLRYIGSVALIGGVAWTIRIYRQVRHA